MEVGGPLPVEVAGGGATVFGSSEPLEALQIDGGGFAVVVSVHLYIRCTDVNLITTGLQKKLEQLSVKITYSCISVSDLMHSFVL